MLLPDNQIQVEYDEELQDYYVAWKPVAAMGVGKTEAEALEDLRQAAYYGVETMVNLKLAEIINREGEKGGKQD